MVDLMVLLPSIGTLQQSTDQNNDGCCSASVAKTAAYI
jgi:hypothetical protein